MNEPHREHLCRQLQEVRLEVEELACSYCVRRVVDALRLLDGVIAVQASAPPEWIDGEVPGTGSVVVRVCRDRLLPQDLVHCLKSAGYAAREVEKSQRAPP